MEQLYCVIGDYDGICMSEPLEKAAAEKRAAELTEECAKDSATFSAMPYQYHQTSWNDMGGATHNAGVEVYDTSTMQEVFPDVSDYGWRAFDYDHVEVSYTDGTTRWFIPNEPIVGSTFHRLLAD